MAAGFVLAFANKKIDVQVMTLSRISLPEIGCLSAHTFTLHSQWRATTAKSLPCTFSALRAFVPLAFGCLALFTAPAGALNRPPVPAHTTADPRDGWKNSRSSELALTGQNLLQQSNAEYDPALSRSEVERSLFVSMRWQQ